MPGSKDPTSTPETSTTPHIPSLDRDTASPFLEGRKETKPQARVVLELWRQRPPSLVQRVQASGKCAVCMPASATSQLPTPRNSLWADSSFLFLDKRQELLGEESLYSEKNFSAPSWSYYSIDQFTGPGSWAEAMLNRAQALKPQFL